MACGVGLLTGLGVAVFNIAEHGLHDLVFLTTASSPERYQLEGVRDVRPDTWLQAVGTVAAPTAAGFAVTGLRFLADGFDGEEKPRWPWANEEERANEDASETPPDASDVLRSAAKPTLKAAAAVVTLGSGASLGPEGPSVEIGASIAGGIAAAGTGTGTGTGTGMGMSDLSPAASSRRLGLIAAGSAAGISAGFGAPIAGLFFAFESILQPAASKGNLEQGGSTGFGPLTTESVILASVLAAVVSAVLLGEQPAFVVPAFELKNLAELPLYLPLGLACGATAVAFRASSSVLGGGFTALERGVGGFGVPRELHAPFGGFAFGLASLLFPEVTYQGFDNVNSMLGAQGSAFRVPYPPTLLLELVVVKLLATSLCRQAGLVGGVYAPSLFMGAALGSAYGAALVPLALQGVPAAPRRRTRSWAWRASSWAYAACRSPPSSSCPNSRTITESPSRSWARSASRVGSLAPPNEAPRRGRAGTRRDRTRQLHRRGGPRGTIGGGRGHGHHLRVRRRGVERRRRRGDRDRAVTASSSPLWRVCRRRDANGRPEGILRGVGDVRGGGGARRGEVRAGIRWGCRGYPPRCAARRSPPTTSKDPSSASPRRRPPPPNARRGRTGRNRGGGVRSNVPTVTSSTTLLDASAAMRANGVPAAVVAGVGAGGVDGSAESATAGPGLSTGPGRRGWMYEPPVGRVGGARWRRRGTPPGRGAARARGNRSGETSGGGNGDGARAVDERTTAT